MNPLIGSALISGAGGLIGGLLGQSGARQQMRFNAQQAQLNRDFQERMSSTAHQRAVDDLRAAGLNPILSATKGGASTPGGAQASTSLNPKQILAHSAANLALTTAQARKAQTEADANSYNAAFAKLKAEGLESIIDMFKSGSGPSGEMAGALPLLAGLLGFKLPFKGKGKGKTTPKGDNGSTNKPMEIVVGFDQRMPPPMAGQTEIAGAAKNAAHARKNGYYWSSKAKQWLRKK